MQIGLLTDSLSRDHPRRGRDTAAGLGVQTVEIGLGGTHGGWSPARHADLAEPLTNAAARDVLRRDITSGGFGWRPSTLPATPSPVDGDRDDGVLRGAMRLAEEFEVGDRRHHVRPVRRPGRHLPRVDTMVWPPEALACWSTSGRRRRLLGRPRREAAAPRREDRCRDACQPAGLQVPACSACARPSVTPSAPTSTQPPARDGCGPIAAIGALSDDRWGRHPRCPCEGHPHRGPCRRRIPARAIPYRRMDERAGLRRLGSGDPDGVAFWARSSPHGVPQARPPVVHRERDYILGQRESVALAVATLHASLAGPKRHFSCVASEGVTQPRDVLIAEVRVPDPERDEGQSRTTRNVVAGPLMTRPRRVSRPSRVGMERKAVPTMRGTSARGHVGRPGKGAVLAAWEQLCRARITCRASGPSWRSPGIAVGSSTGSTRTSPRLRGRRGDRPHARHDVSSPSWVSGRVRGPRRGRRSAVSSPSRLRRRPWPSGATRPRWRSRHAILRPGSAVQVCGRHERDGHGARGPRPGPDQGREALVPGVPQLGLRGHRVRDVVTREPIAVLNISFLRTRSPRPREAAGERGRQDPVHAAAARPEQRRRAGRCVHAGEGPVRHPLAAMDTEARW